MPSCSALLILESGKLWRKKRSGAVLRLGISRVELVVKQEESVPSSQTFTFYFVLIFCGGG